MPTQKNNFPSSILYGAIICAVGALFYCYEFILRIIPGALQTELSAAYGNISATTFGEISALYYFAYSPMQIPVGVLMDKYGPRRLLMFACFACALGSMMFSYTDSIFISGVGRFLVGFGSSFAFVGVLSLAIHWLPRQYFSLVAGLITTLGMLGLIFGEVNITKIAITYGWKQVLYALVILGFVLLFFMYFIVKDAPGSVTTQNAKLKDFFKNVWIVLKSHQVWIISIIGACLYGSLSILGELWGKTYLEQVHHLSKIDAANTISAVFLGWAVGAPVSGYFSDKTGKHVLILVIGAIVSLLSISLVLYKSNLTYWELNALLFVYGVFSATEIIVFIMGKEAIDANLSATVFAVVNMIITLGGVIFQPLVGKLLDMFGGSTMVSGEYVYSVQEYQVALSVLPISLLLVLILSFFLKQSKSKASI